MSELVRDGLGKVWLNIRRIICSDAKIAPNEVAPIGELGEKKTRLENDYVKHFWAQRNDPKDIHDTKDGPLGISGYERSLH